MYAYISEDGKVGTGYQAHLAIRAAIQRDLPNEARQSSWSYDYKTPPELNEENWIVVRGCSFDLRDDPLGTLYEVTSG